MIDWPEPIVTQEAGDCPPNDVPVPMVLGQAEVCALCGSGDWSSKFGERRTWTMHAGQYVALHEGDCDVTYAVSQRPIIQARERARVTNIKRAFKGSGKHRDQAPTLDGLD